MTFAVAEHPEHPRRQGTLIERALLRHRTFILEWFLGLEALFLGLYMIMPGPTFTTATALADIPEPLTGLLFMAQGGITLWILTRENAPKTSRSQRNLDHCRWSALSSAAFWTCILASYVMAPPALTSMSVPLTFSFVLASLWVYFRLYLRFKP